AAVFVFAVGATVFETRTLLARENTLRTITDHDRAVSDEITALRKDREQLQQRLSALHASSHSGGPQAPGPGETELAATLQQWLERIDRLRATLAEKPSLAIPELSLLEEKDWIDLASSSQLETDVDYRQALASLRA